MSYQVKDPHNLVILDASILAGWRRDDLEELAHRFRLIVTDALMCEIHTKTEHHKAIALARKLLGLKCLVAEPLQSHLFFEVRHVEPAGLLLEQEGSPGFPERAAPRLIREFVRIIELSATDPEYTSAASEFRHLDSEDEEKWKETVSRVVAECRDNEDIRQARQLQGGAFFSHDCELTEGLERSVHNLLPTFVADITSRLERDQGMQVDPVTWAGYEGVDRAWTLWRNSVAGGAYLMKAASDDVSVFTRRRLNQRMDLRYVALCGPGMILATRDREMIALARMTTGDDVRTVSEPDEM